MAYLDSTGLQEQIRYIKAYVASLYATKESVQDIIENSGTEIGTVSDATIRSYWTNLDPDTSIINADGVKY